MYLLEYKWIGFVIFLGLFVSLLLFNQFFWYPENRGSAAPVQNLCEQLLQPQISHLAAPDYNLSEQLPHTKLSLSAALVPEKLLQYFLLLFFTTGAAPGASAMLAVLTISDTPTVFVAASFFVLVTRLWRAVPQWVASPYSGSSGLAADSSAGLWRAALPWAASLYSESSAATTNM